MTRPDRPAGDEPPPPTAATRARRTVGAVAVGVGSGIASAVFLRSLEAVTTWHHEHPSLLWALPGLGLVIGLVVARWGGRASGGVGLTMAEIEDLRGGVPLRMAPLALGGTLLTHLGGGSAGREGTALQMATGLTDGLARRLGLPVGERRVLLIAALAGGFGSVFGVPWAGAVFAVEVAPTSWRHRRGAAVAALVAAWVGHGTAHLVGIRHEALAPLRVAGLVDLLRVAAVGVAAGLVAAAFVGAVATVRSASVRLVPWAPARPALGGAAVVALTLGLGTRAYSGLSLPLLDDALAGSPVPDGAFALKALLTALTVGSGLIGGEVTPLFVIGATGGSALAGVVGGPAPLLAGVGMVATFGAAANAPLASAVMGVELFGWRAAPAMALGCVVARRCSGAGHLYQHH